MCTVGEAPHGQNRHLVCTVHAETHAEMVNPYSGLWMLLLFSVSSANKSFAFYTLKALSPSEGVAKGHACMQCGLQGDFIIALPEAGAASDRLLTARPDTSNKSRLTTNI